MTIQVSANALRGVSDPSAPICMRGPSSVRLALCPYTVIEEEFKWATVLCHKGTLLRKWRGWGQGLPIYQPE